MPQPTQEMVAQIHVQIRAKSLGALSRPRYKINLSVVPDRDFAVQKIAFTQRTLEMSSGESRS
jgi:hypothetical protein